jgi:hypothetical protein
MRTTHARTHCMSADARPDSLQSNDVIAATIEYLRAAWHNQLY